MQIAVQGTSEQHHAPSGFGISPGWLLKLFGLIIGGTMSSIALAGPITLYYENRLPFMFVQNGELSGSEGKVAVDAFAAAGIEFTLSEAPVSRQVVMVSNNLEPACAIGLYWTAELPAPYFSTSQGLRA